MKTKIFAAFAMLVLLGVIVIVRRPAIQEAGGKNPAAVSHSTETTPGMAAEQGRASSTTTAEKTGRDQAKGSIDRTPTAVVSNLSEEAEKALLAKIPEGDLRTDLFKLKAEVRSRVLARISEQQIPKEDFGSLRVSPEGDLFYVCVFKAQPKAQGSPAVQDDNSGVFARAEAGGIEQAPVPISTPPARHSRPGATRVLYLDFNGHTITGTAWNSGGNTLVARPFDTDGNETTFSDAEQTLIVQVWERMAEDFAPFDVDVTTEEPATFTSTTGRALITRNIDANGVDMPSVSAGGVAYLSVFGSSNYATYYSPALIYFNNLGNSVSNIAEAASHELGHNLGLSHDGLTSGSAYYGGHGSGDTSWGPLMGTGYGKNVSQWSKGEYYLANNPQDDLSIIAGRLTLRPDDVGDSTATAAPLAVTAGSFSGTGVLHSSSDVDVFSVTLGAGTLNLSAIGYRAASSTQGGNTDLKLELLDAGGGFIASDDSASTTKCSLPIVVVAGNYFIRISASQTGSPLTASPTGYTSYGCLGQYTLSGTVTTASNVAPAFTTQPVTQAVVNGSGVTFTAAATGNPAPTYQWYFKGAAISGATGTTYSIATTSSTNTGNYHVVATNSAGTATSSSAYLTVQYPAVITSQPASISIPSTTNTTLTVTTTGVPTPTYQWYQGTSGTTTSPVSGATSASFTTPSLTATTSYWVRVTNLLATVDSNAATVTVVPNVAPSIATQPVSQTAIAGNNATFSVVASGTPAPTYQWFFNGAAIANATSSSYTVASVAPSNAGNYYVRVSNLAGNLNSSTVALTVNVIPSITTQPTSTSILSGATATLNVTASGTPTPTYQWYQGASGVTTTPVAGATSATFVTPTLTATTSYWVRVSNVAGAANSNTATVTIAPALQPPIITSATVAGAAVGEPFSYAIAASNFPASFAAPALPAGLSLNTVTGIITGTPTVAGTISVTLSATNAAGTGNAALSLLVLPATTITTFAGVLGGSGTTNSSTPTLARFNAPFGIASDSTGVIYIADSLNNQIRKVALSGAVTTFAGATTSGTIDGTGAAARFNNPRGVAVDASGNVYVADTNNSTIRSITPAGASAHFAGAASMVGSTDGTGLNARFNQPSAVAVDASGNVYVADTGNHTIRKITPAREVTTLAGLAGSSGAVDGTGTAARFSSPNAVAVDSVGNIYVADCGNHTIRKVTPTGVVTTVAGTAGIAGTADGLGTTAQFSSPAGLALNDAGGLYVADTANHTLRLIRISDGLVVTVAGASGTSGAVDGSGISVRFNRPCGLMVDPDGYLFVADNSNHGIRVTSSGPSITTHPLSQSVAAGAAVTFTATVIGHPMPTLQWYKDNVAVTGSTSATLTLTNVQSTDDGAYKLVATNNMGSATSNTAMLTVNGSSSPSSSSGSSSASSSGAPGSGSSSGGGGGAPGVGFFAALVLLALGRRADRW